METLAFSSALTSYFGSINFLAAERAMENKSKYCIYSFEFTQSYFGSKKTWNWFAQSLIHPISHFVVIHNPSYIIQLAQF